MITVYTKYLKSFAVSCLAVVEKQRSEALKPFKGIIVQS
jgi:hypothetical protein